MGGLVFDDKGKVVGHISSPDGLTKEVLISGKKNMAQSYTVQNVAKGFSRVTRKTITGRISMITTVAESV